MLAEYAAMCIAIRARSDVACRDHDEALFAIVYRAKGNPVLTDLIQTLWNRCRAYKIVGPKKAFDTSEDAPLWKHPS